MPNPTKNDKPTRTGEYEKVDKEVRLAREPERPKFVPELDVPHNIGSTTGIMRIRREANDETSQGDEDSPV